MPLTYPQIAGSFLLLAVTGLPGQLMGADYASVQLIDTNPTGGDFIDGLISVGDRWLFNAYDGSQHKTYSTDGQSVELLLVEENGSLQPEPLFSRASNWFGISRLDGVGYFVANGAEGTRPFYAGEFRVAVVIGTSETRRSFRARQLPETFSRRFGKMP